MITLPEPSSGRMPMTRIAVALTLLALAAPAQALAGGEASIFYYPWYGNPQRDGGYSHWDQSGHVPPVDLATSYYPARGAYSSSDPAVVHVQMREIARAGIREVVSSWWGWGSPEDERLPAVARAARERGLDVAAQIEPYDGRSADGIVADIAHLHGLGITRFYVYQPFVDIDDVGWKATLRRLPGVQVLAQTGNVARAAADGFGGVYTYDIVEYGPSSFAHFCSRAHQLHLVCAPSVGPGYEAMRATGDTHARPRRDGATYDSMWRAALGAHADRVTITSYNEWHEGTQIEPALTPLPRTLAVSGGGSASPVTRAYASYDGAYGLLGKAAERAYLSRTAFWTALYGASSSSGRSPQAACAGRRESSPGGEAGSVATSPQVTCRTHGTGARVFASRAVHGPRLNLLSTARPSRLNLALRTTDENSVVRPLGQGAQGSFGGRCYAVRPLALIDMFAGASCPGTSRYSRNTSSSRSTENARFAWGKASVGKGG